MKSHFNLLYDFIFTHRKLLQFSAKILRTSSFLLLFSSPFLGSAQNNKVNISIISCAGDSTLIKATTAQNFTGWQNDQGNTNGISDPDSLITWVNTKSTSKYMASALQTGDNLIYNGDFEQGVKGFWSEYTNSFTENGFNQYTVTKNPLYFSPQFISRGDHTSGSGNMFIANGNSTFQKKIIFGQDLKITEGQIYLFSIWLANTNKEFQKSIPDTTVNSTGYFEFRIDTLLLGTFKLPLDSSWYNFTIPWKATHTGMADFMIKSRASSQFGSDFLMDDISVIPLITVQSPLVTLSPCNHLPVFSPDGDGLYDDYFIDKPGTAKIFDVGGNLINQITAPGSWDGSTLNGSMAGTGYYAIVVEGSIFHVSLIR